MPIKSFTRLNDYKIPRTFNIEDERLDNMRTHGKDQDKIMGGDLPSNPLAHFTRLRAI
jgi:hypothetical protein